MFIHLSWVNEEDNSGGLISLSKCKIKLNRLGEGYRGREGERGSKAVKKREGKSVR